MHPDRHFQADQAAMHALVDEVRFGMVFATTPAGPRIAHVPLVPVDGAMEFHLSRANALAPHVAGTTALLVVNGPDHYVSPRWYADRRTVPTWNYVALELEGPVRAMADDRLDAHLNALIVREEARLDGAAWRAEETPGDVWRGLFDGIAGFVLEPEACRPTFKLSQNKSATDRAAVAAGLAQAGAGALAARMGHAA